MIAVIGINVRSCIQGE